MHFAPRHLLLALALSLSACARGPSRAEALAAIRAAQPTVEGSAVYGRVWQDGPPWFSCAEVLAKVGSVVDSAAVSGRVGNWKPLIVAGWAALRDTARGPVTEPGWCVLKPIGPGEQAIARWTPGRGALFPTGQPRRGWTMLVGRRTVLVPKSPTSTGQGTAAAPYVVALAPNANGVALGANRDTSHFVAQLSKVGGVWTMTSSEPVAGR